MTQSWFGSHKKCILAVDDAAFILSRITDALGKYYNMVTVNSGSRALKYLDKNKPDLILLDIRMPIRDGFDILREIRSMEDRADIPVIMLTAMEDKQSVMRGIELGVCDYVLKPFAPDDLLERVQRILNPKKKNWISSSEYGGESRQEGVQGSITESRQEDAQKSVQEGRQESAQESAAEGGQGPIAGG